MFNFSFKGLKGTPGDPGWVNVNLTDLDNEKNYMAQVQRGERTMLNVLSEGKLVGVVFQYSDGMGHVLTQEFLTHYIVHQGFTGATANFQEHDHNRIVKLTRIYSNSGWPIEAMLGPSKFISDENYNWSLNYFQNLGYNTNRWPTTTWPANRWTPWRDMALEDAICADRRWKSDRYAGVREQYVLHVTEAPGVTAQMVTVTRRGELVYVSNGKTGGDLNLGGATYGLAMKVGGEYYLDWPKTELENQAISHGWLVRTNLGNVYKAQLARQVLFSGATSPTIVDASSILQNTYSKSEVDTKLKYTRENKTLPGQQSSVAIMQIIKPTTDCIMLRLKGSTFVQFDMNGVADPEKPRTIIVVADDIPSSERQFYFDDTTAARRGVNFLNFSKGIPNNPIKWGVGKGFPTILFELRVYDGFAFLHQL